MKKYLFLAIAALSLTACADDFLDRQPLDKVSDAAVFNNAGLSEAYVNALYTSIPDPMQEGNISCITDEAFFRYGGSSTRYMADGTVTSENVSYDVAHSSRTTILNIWTRAYDRIRKMNLFLENTKNSNIDKPTLDRLTGEVYYLRAWVYTNLIQRYAGVPIITKVYALGDDYTVERSKFDDCVEFIYGDLDKAYELLPEKDATATGRINKDIALALRSRLALIVASPLFNDPQNPEGSIFRGAYSQDKWKKAYDAAKAIVKRIDDDGAYAIADSYDDYWMNINSKEVIWAKYYTLTNGNKAQLEYTPENGGIGGYESMSPTETLIADYEMANGKKFFEEGSGYDPNHPWANRDPRLYKTILLNFTEYRDVPSFEYCYFFEPGKYMVDNTAENRAKFPNGEVDADDAKKYHPFPHGYTLADFASGKPAIDYTSKSKYLSDPVTNTGYQVRKWHIPSQPVTTQVNYSLMFPWFRVPEFYLNLAEAAYHLGGSYEAEARTYVNKIRARADVQMPPITESGESLYDRIINERRIEFALENQRYFDTRRLKIAPEVEDRAWFAARIYVLQQGTYHKNENGSVISDVTSSDTLYRVSKVYDPSYNNNYRKATYNHTWTNSQKSTVFTVKWLGKTYKIDYGDCAANLAPTEKAWDNKMYLQPIPADEIAKAPYLEQNPGY